MSCRHAHVMRFFSHNSYYISKPYVDRVRAGMRARFTRGVACACAATTRGVAHPTTGVHR